MQVSEILLIKGTTLYTITPNKTLADAVSIMSELDIGSLVCFDKGKVVGMLTFREVLKGVHLGGSEWKKTLVSDCMMREPTIAPHDMEMDDLRRLLIQNHQRYVPVMDEDMLMGVVSFLDVARAVLEEQSFENKMLKAYIRDWPNEKERES